MEMYVQWGVMVDAYPYQQCLHQFAKCIYLYFTIFPFLRLLEMHCLTVQMDTSIHPEEVPVTKRSIRRRVKQSLTKWSWMPCKGTTLEQNVYGALKTIPDPILAPVPKICHCPWNRRLKQGLSRRKHLPTMIFQKTLAAILAFRPDRLTWLPPRLFCQFWSFL